MPDDHVAKTVSVYDGIANEYAVNMNDYAPDVEQKKFVELVSKGGSVLDLGCAAGRDSIYFSARGFHTTGVDLSDNLLAIARKRAPNLTFVHQDIRKLQFPMASFDGIWACAVLLHLKTEEIPKVMKDCYRLLKPQGILFLMMKKGTGEADIAEQLSSGKLRHYTLFQQNEINRIVRDAGFTILETYEWNSRDRYIPARDVEWISVFARK